MDAKVITFDRIAILVIKTNDEEYEYYSRDLTDRFSVFTFICGVCKEFTSDELTNMVNNGYFDDLTEEYYD